MSRYQIPTRELRYACVVGWDPPLGTFFARIEDTTVAVEDPRREVLWVGTGLHELVTVDALANAIAAYAVLPLALYQQLASEHRTIGFRPTFGTRILQDLGWDSTEDV